MWRHVPRGAHPLDFAALISAGGRWNRKGLYGCLYTALNPVAVAGEYRKHFVRRGLRRDRDLVCLAVEIEYVLDLPSILDSGMALAPALVPAIPGGAVTGTYPAPRLDRARLVGDGDADLEHCRTIADWARHEGYLAVLAPSAAVKGEAVLAIYPENRPRELRIGVQAGPHPLNYGSDPFVDEDGWPRRTRP